MLGKTAGGLFWMSRYLERSKNIARLVDAGFRIALTRAQSSEKDWESILATTGTAEAYHERYDNLDSGKVIDFMLRDTANPFSVISVMKNARQNARLSRTALTRDVWEAVNEAWLLIRKRLDKPIAETDLPAVLGLIKRQTMQVQGAFHATMLRNDIYDFARLGTFVERADNTARILDVKYYVLLPSAASVGSPLDNMQWENVLRSVSAEQAYRWLHQDEITSSGIAHFLILDSCLPQSLIFCVKEIDGILWRINDHYGADLPSSQLNKELLACLDGKSISEIFEGGLHEFIIDFLARNNALAAQIETDYRFWA
ncbi:alpha-E domain-containing protein [Robiginitomaculum antarcticum]|uniref:alpha-E domain-containing protein n=1 Tax=Robiginitomaculum antarcticum TaxID=437507 RepID=UPI00037051B8|nr:alpha-E domain-containing protein [Robiginitomaculum antarcticum]